MKDILENCKDVCHKCSHYTFCRVCASCIIAVLDISDMPFP